MRAFEPGKGATGVAFREKGLIVATDDAVFDDTYGLTQPQQEAFRDYKSVAATPIWFEDQQVVGVLTAVSKVNDGYFASGGAGGPVIRELAEVVAVVLKNIYGHVGVQ